jgi:hypothetical protein
LRALFVGLVDGSSVDAGQCASCIDATNSGLLARLQSSSAPSPPVTAVRYVLVPEPSDEEITEAEIEARLDAHPTWSSVSTVETPRRSPRCSR